MALTVVGAAVAGPAVASFGFEGTLDVAAVAVAACSLALAPSVVPLSIDAQPSRNPDARGLTSPED